ncbi:MAG TPA: IclR family transcriptional regulator [Propionibacteriaceae bacterium]
MTASPGVDSALAVLTLLARMPEPMPASLISRTLGLPRSSTYRLLSTLGEHGFVSYLPDQRRYGLGLAVFELGSAYQRQAPLARIARPLVERLVRDTIQNAHLAVLHGRDVYYVLEHRAPGRRGLVTDVGVRLPATITASGLAMLAQLPRAGVRALFPDADALVRRNGLGPATPGELRAILTAVRLRGYALEEDSVTLGLSSVARAVLDHSGHPVAAVTVTYVTQEIDAGAVQALVSAVARTADQLALRLGGLPGQA